ncbi:probable WRKY transcription factor protein 1 [Aethina tumida]|uniref:probable WRKY transcription factor protein 1 n=1 Tax=Aethina tumida TaxID=116153 RepID=UPI0021494751|nr:probable WRKY transcription factor protein 1 [Aethina tumida]
MVKALLVGLLAATICAFVFSAPAARNYPLSDDPPTLPAQPLPPSPPSPPSPSPQSTNQSNHRPPEPQPQSQPRTQQQSQLQHQHQPQPQLDPEPPLEDDPAARSERSTNLSHVSGTARKIQMFIKNRHLQLLPDGTVNGTTDDTSPYTILQRTAVGKGQMRIQGVATCQYLCMDSCGLLYGSLEFGDDCVFNETMEQHNYNTYSSTKYSNERKTLYLALNRRGQPRKVVLRARHQLGKLSSYTRALLRHVSLDRSEEIHARHHRHCPTTAVHQSHYQSPTRSHDPPRCRKRKKRKKKKRKCPEDEFDPELCQKRQSVSNNSQQEKAAHRVLKCDDKDNKDNDECQRDVTKRKHKNNNNNNNNNNNKSLVSVLNKKKKKNRKGVRKRLEMETTSTEATMTITSTVTSPPEEVTPDEDYGVDSSTHIDWEDSTALPDIPMAVSDATRLTAETHIDSD